MVKGIAFVVLSAGIVYISRKSLRIPGSHGFYRFFAWEIILALFLLNMHAWFRDPLCWHQLVSWSLLSVGLVPLVLGVRALRGRGRPAQERASEPQLLAFERTSALVTDGVYAYIRHPLYSSLLLLAWGIAFKLPTWYGALLALAATGFLLATAKADEAECRRFFGAPYETYMKRTARFVPFLF
jgi:protein-S-isoprenylcysteine O-methyltransferase Ste14